jgi:hypothetical protein
MTLPTIHKSKIHNIAEALIERLEHNLQDAYDAVEARMDAAKTRGARRKLGKLLGAIEELIEDDRHQDEDDYVSWGSGGDSDRIAERRQMGITY